MKLFNHSINKVTKKIVFLLGCISLISIIALDKLNLSNSIFKEERPIFTIQYIIRSAVILIAIVAIFWSLVDSRRPKIIIRKNDRASFELISILI